MSTSPGDAPTTVLRALLTFVALVVTFTGLWLILVGWPEGSLASRLAASGAMGTYLGTLAVLLTVVWRTRLDSVASMLVVFLISILAVLDTTMLAALANAWFYGEVLMGPGPGWLSASTWFLMALVLSTGSAALLRFSVLFPEPLRNEDIVVLLSQGRDHESRALDRYWAFSRALLDRMPSLLRFENSSRDLGRSPRLPIVAIAVATPALFGPVGFLITGLGAVLMAASAGGNLLSSYSLADPDGRRQVLWIMMGLGPIATVLMGLAAGSAGFVTGFTGGSETWTALAVRFPRNVLWLASIPVTVGVSVLVAMLSIGIFRSGALDPSLVLRRTAVYGALGTALLFGFGVFEAFASDALMEWVGLPQGLGTWFAAGLAAVAVKPLRGGLDRTVGAAVAHQLPQWGDFEDAEAHAYLASMLATTSEGQDAETEQVYAKAAQKAANRHKGRVAKTTGRSALLTFAAADDAVAAAVTLSDTVRVACEVLDLPAPAITIGVAETEAGGAEHAAALASRAKSGGIFVAVSGEVALPDGVLRQAGAS